MNQNYAQYTDEHQLVWKTLFERQQKNLNNKAVPEYLYCLDKMKNVFNEGSIPRFEELNELLYSTTGWEIKVVPGLIPAVDFLSLLSDKKFCSSTWLRSFNQLDYLEEPDMFHDLFGHVPLLLNHEYSNFMKSLGDLGKEHAYSQEAIVLLERFYWYTIEFGLVTNISSHQIYGAGIISSYQESNSIYETPSIYSYNLNDILNNHFVKDNVQTKYYALNGSISSLFNSIELLSQQIKLTVSDKQAKQIDIN